MAKDDDDDDVAQDRMSEDSLAYLDQARKGKVRTFVMSVKGAAVRSLLVKKKSIKDGDLKEARGQGFQPVFGSVSGNGAQLIFTIARADGFDAPPGRGKVDKLKKFLSAQTDRTFKPEWVLVDELPPPPFDEEDLQHPLIARFVRLETQLAQVCQARPDEAAGLKKEAAGIRDLLLDPQSIDQAAGPIDVLEQRLSALSNQATAGSSSTPGTVGNQPPSSDATQSSSRPSPSDQPPSNQPKTEQPKTEQTSADESKTLASKLAEGLKRLRPVLDQVIQAQPHLKAELVSAMGQIVAAIKEQRFDQAKQDMLAYGARLKALLSQPSSQAGNQADAQPQTQSTSPDTSGADELQKRCEQLEPLLLQAQAADRDKATKLGAVWQMVLDLIEGKNFAKATQSLNALQKAINDILAAAANKSDAERFGIREGLVKDMRDRILGIRRHWTQTLRAAAAEIGKVQTGVMEADPELAYKLSEVLNDYVGKVIELAARYEKSQTADEIQKGLSEIGAEVDALRTRFKDDPVLPFLDVYPFQSVSVTKTFEQAFAELDKMLATPS